MVRDINNILGGISGWGPLSSFVRRANRAQHLKLREKTKTSASKVLESGNFHLLRMQNRKSSHYQKRRITKK